MKSRPAARSVTIALVCGATNVTVEWQADRSDHAMPFRGHQPSTAFGLSTTDERDNSLDVSPAIDDVASHFGESMRRTARRHGLSEDEIDDAIQDVGIRLWRARTGEKIRRAPASYLHRTVVSAAIGFIRRRRARRESVVERDDVSTLNIEDTPRARIARWMKGRLRPRYRGRSTRSSKLGARSCACTVRATNAKRSRRCSVGPKRRRETCSIEDRMICAPCSRRGASRPRPPGDRHQ